MRKYEHGEIAEIILSTLLVAGVIVVAATMPNAIQLFKYFKPKNAYERSRIKQSINHLDKQGFVKRKGEVFMLTTAGIKKAKYYKMRSMKIAQQKIWDKKWRLIMFDVPEKKKSARRAINHMLKELGCVHYQKSVFITPYPCEKEIDIVRDYFEVRKHVMIILAEKIEDEDTIKKTFNL